MTMWMNLEYTQLEEVSQTQEEDKSHAMSPYCIDSKQNRDRQAQKTWKMEAISQMV